MHITFTPPRSPAPNPQPALPSTPAADDLNPAAGHGGFNPGGDVYRGYASRPASAASMGCGSCQGSTPDTFSPPSARSVAALRATAEGGAHPAPMSFVVFAANLDARVHPALEDAGLATQLTYELVALAIDPTAPPTLAAIALGQARRLAEAHGHLAGEVSAASFYAAPSVSQSAEPAADPG